MLEANAAVLALFGDVCVALDIIASRAVEALRALTLCHVVCLCDRFSLVKAKSVLGLGY